MIHPDFEFVLAQFKAQIYLFIYMFLFIYFMIFYPILMLISHCIGQRIVNAKLSFARPLILMNPIMENVSQLYPIPVSALLSKSS